MASWLSIQEYSTQQGISISTLRRKIKRREIEYTFEKEGKGRYLLRAPEEKASSNTVKELKSHYEKLLSQKEITIKKLKEDREDLLCLLDFLEKEKIKD